MFDTCHQQVIISYDVFIESSHFPYVFEGHVSKNIYLFSQRTVEVRTLYARRMLREKHCLRSSYVLKLIYMHWYGCMEIWVYGSCQPTTPWSRILRYRRRFFSVKWSWGKTLNMLYIVFIFWMCRTSWEAPGGALRGSRHLQEPSRFTSVVLRCVFTCWLPKWYFTKSFRHIGCQKLFFTMCFHMLELRSIVLLLVVCIVDLRSVILRCVFNMLELSSVILRCVCHSWEFRSVVLLCILHSLEFRSISRYQLRCVCSHLWSS